MFRWARNRKRNVVDDRIAIAIKGHLPNIVEAKIRDLLMLTNENAEPNVNNLWQLAKDIDLIKLNIKFFGYEMAQALAERLPCRTGLAPRPITLMSKASTQEDLESDWAAYWAQELGIRVSFHRKLWEMVSVLQALWQNGCLESGSRGLGFGCGEELLPSYLASRNVSVVATDLPSQDRASRVWQKTRQHAGALDNIYHAQLVDRQAFQEMVTLDYVDMNAIPRQLQDFHFCWSISAMHHLGNIGNGLRFVEKAMDVLRPGGVAVHTAEFNFANDTETIDNWPTVLFQKRHFIALAERLRQKGHFVAPLDFSVGGKVLDRFVDLPPFAQDLPDNSISGWVPSASHLKLAIDGFASTCFSILIRKKAA